MQYIKLALIAFCMAAAGAFYSAKASAAAATAAAATTNAALEALNANRLDAARALLVQQLPDPNSKNSALTLLGEVELHAGNFDKAIDYLQQAIAANPNVPVNHFLLGRSYGQKAQTLAIFSALGMAKKCIASFETGHSLDPKNTRILQALVEYHLAAPAIAGGSQEKLSQHLAELKIIAPDLAELYETMRLERDKKHAEALKMALELKRKTNLPVTAQYSLARFFKKHKSYSEAEEVLERLIKAPVTSQTNFDERRDINDASLQLAEVFLATHQQLDRAAILIKNFHKNINPNDVHYIWGFWSLAKIYKAMGNMDKYQSEVQQIKTLDYKTNKHFAQEFEAAIKNQA